MERKTINLHNTLFSNGQELCYNAKQEKIRRKWEHGGPVFRLDKCCIRYKESDVCR